MIVHQVTALEQTLRNAKCDCTGPGRTLCATLNMSVCPGLLLAGKPIVYVLISCRCLHKILSCFFGERPLIAYSFSTAPLSLMSQTRAGYVSVGRMPTYSKKQSLHAECSAAVASSQVGSFGVTQHTLPVFNASMTRSKRQVSEPSGST